MEPLKLPASESSPDDQILGPLPEGTHSSQSLLIKNGGRSDDDMLVDSGSQAVEASTKPSSDDHPSMHNPIDDYGISQLNSSQESVAKHPPPQYNLHFRVSETETQFPDSQQDGSFGSQGSQKENAPLPLATEEDPSVAAPQAQRATPSSDSFGGGYKSAQDPLAAAHTPLPATAGSMLPPPPRVPFIPSTPPLKHKPARAVSFVSPHASPLGSTKDIARSKTLPTHLNPRRPQRSPSPPSQDSFGGPVLIEDPAAEYARHSSQFNKPASQLLADTQDSAASSSQYSELYGPRSPTKYSAFPSTISSLKGKLPPSATGMSKSNRSLAIPPSQTDTIASSPESSQSSQPTRSQMEDSFAMRHPGIIEADAGPKASTRAAIFARSQEQFPNLAVSMASINSSIPGLNAARRMAEEMQPTQLVGYGSTQLEPTQLEPTQLEPTQLLATQLEPTQLEPTQLEPVQITPVQPATKVVPPGQEVLTKSGRLTRPPKAFVMFNDEDDMEQPQPVTDVSRFSDNSILPTIQVSDFTASSGEPAETQPEVATQLERDVQIEPPVSIVAARPGGNIPLTRHYRVGEPLAISPYAAALPPVETRPEVTAQPSVDAQLETPASLDHAHSWGFPPPAHHHRVGAPYAALPPPAAPTPKRKRGVSDALRPPELDVPRPPPSPPQSPPTKRFRKDSDPGEVVPESDPGFPPELTDDDELPRPAVRNAPARVAPKPVAQSTSKLAAPPTRWSKPDSSADHVSATEDEEEIDTDEGADNDDVPLAARRPSKKPERPAVSEDERDGLATRDEIGNDDIPMVVYRSPKKSKAVRNEAATDDETDDDDVPLVAHRPPKKSERNPTSRSKNGSSGSGKQVREAPSMASSEDIPLASIIPVRAHRMAQVSNPIPASRPERLDGENHEMGEEPASERFPKPAAKRKGKYRANQPDGDASDLLEKPLTKQAKGTRKTRGAVTPTATNAASTTSRAKGKQKALEAYREDTMASSTTATSVVSRKIWSAGKAKAKGKKLATRAASSRLTKGRRLTKSKSASASKSPDLDFSEADGPEGTEVATTELADDDSADVPMDVDSDDNSNEAAGNLPVPSTSTGGPSRNRHRRVSKSAMSTISTSTAGTPHTVATRASGSRNVRAAVPTTPSIAQAVEGNEQRKIRVLALWNNKGFYPGTIRWREGAEFTDFRVDFDDNDSLAVKLGNLRRLELRPGDEIRWGKSSRAQQGVVHEFEEKPDLPRGNKLEGQRPSYNLKARELRGDGLVEPEGIFWVLPKTIKDHWQDRIVTPSDVERVPRQPTVQESPRTRAVSKSTTKQNGSSTAFWKTTGCVITGSGGGLAKEKARITKTLVRDGATVLNNWTDIFSEMGNHWDTLWIATQADLAYDPGHNLDRVFLLANMPCRTPKFLMALALGIPCISFRWIDECIADRSIVKFSPFLLPAGTSKNYDTPELGLLSWGQLADPSWGDDQCHLHAITEARCAFRPFVGKAILVVSENYVPPTNGEDLHTACVPRVILAMGAKTVVAVKPRAVLKAGQVRDIDEDGRSRSGPLIQYDYVVYEKETDRANLPASLPLAPDVKYVDWPWVTDCLIARRLWSVPA